MNQVKKVQVDEILPATKNNVVQVAVNEIRNASSDARTAVLKLAKTLQKWNAKKEWGQIEKILDKDKIVSESVRKKLMRIGSNPILMNEDYWDKLPIGYSQLYPLTQIDENELVKLIEKKQVHDGLTVEKSNELKNKHRTKTEPAQRKTKFLHYTIKIKVSSEAKNINSVVKTQFNEFKKTIKEHDKNAIIEM